MNYKKMFSSALRGLLPRPSRLIRQQQYKVVTALAMLDCTERQERTVTRQEMANTKVIWRRKS